MKKVLGYQVFSSDDGLLLGDAGTVMSWQDAAEIAEEVSYNDMCECEIWRVYEDGTTWTAAHYFDGVRED